MADFFTSTVHAAPVVKHVVQHPITIFHGVSYMTTAILAGVAFLAGVVVDGMLGIYAKVKGWFVTAKTDVTAIEAKIPTLPKL